MLVNDTSISRTLVKYLDWSIWVKIGSVNSWMKLNYNLGNKIENEGDSDNESKNYFVILVIPNVA